MNDFELEDLEAHLYSQVYHSNECEGIEADLNTSINENEQKSVGNMRKPNRYFQKNSKRTRNKFQKKSVFGEQYNRQPPLPNDYNQARGSYSKNWGRPNKTDISINQVVVLNPPPQRSVVCVTGRKKREIGQAKWMKTKEWKKKKAADKSFNHQQEVIKSISEEKAKSDIITVSDSDDESCVEIPNKWPVLSLTDSDDEAEIKQKEEKGNSENPNPIKIENQELPTTSEDDIIFVEHGNSATEIINLDEEIETNSQRNSTEKGQGPDVETASVCSSNNSFLNTPTRSKSNNSHKERKELLSTPDSASNDFINTSGVELSQSNFNFSLHGTDFNNGEFVKPANPSYETESTSSISDVNTFKTSVFSEVEFPKEDIFSEANLESFGNFITPIRTRVTKKTIESTPVNTEINPSDQNVYSSDSSSESDYEDSPIDVQKKVKSMKNLPDLSPMQMKSYVDRTIVKKTKKIPNFSSKYHFLNSSDENPGKQLKQKKRKTNQTSDNTSCEESPACSKKKPKNKKKKSDIENKRTDDTKMDAEASGDLHQIDLGIKSPVINQDNSETEAKQKKRKSSQILENSEDNSETNKKKLKKKKKSETTQNTESDGNADVSSLTSSDSKEFVEKSCENSNLNVEHPDVKQNEELREPSEEVAVHVKEDLGEELKCEVQTVVKEEKSVEIEEVTEESPAVKSEEITVSNNTNVEPMVLDENEKNSVQKLEDLGLEDLIVIDETFCDDHQIIISSDGESELSNLNAPQDIQLINCKNPQFERNTLAFEPPPPRTSLDLKYSSLEEVQHSMSNDPKLWKILDIDRFRHRNDKKERRCNRCREKGHMAIRCPNKVDPKCRLCGEMGHFEPRCPNRICTQCGQRSNYSTTYCKYCFKFKNHQCQLCSMMGHAAETCPDLWRRYHLTTTDGPLTIYNGPILKPRNKLWCSGCAQSGHLEYTCRYYRAPYPPSDPHIQSYENIYENDSRNRPDLNLGPQTFNQNMRYDHHGFPLNQHDIYVDNNEHFNYYPNQENLMYGTPDTPNNAFVNPNRSIDLVYDDGSDRPNDNFCFEDNLPNFISFDSPLLSTTQLPSSQNYEERSVFQYNTPKEVFTNYNSVKKLPESNRKDNKQVVFFSSSTEAIRGLISMSLSRLTKLSYNAKNVVRSLKQTFFSRGKKMQKNYRTLNMILFGVFHLNDGKFHLEKLKKFKLKQVKTKLSQTRRQDLYKSYCYIFGVQKHAGLDYNELLRRI